MKNKLIAFSMDFASFLIQKTKNKDKIKNIILFGSVAREEANENSDIDIFIDLTKEDKKTEKEIANLLTYFLDSTKYKNYWKLLEIENEIKLTIGELNKWNDLKSSILSNGILLYGKFKTDIKKGEHKIFFIWENIKPNSKRVLFNKQIFGYNQGKKFYKGMLQKYDGERLGKGCIIVPLEYSNIFNNIFKKCKITVKIKKVLEY
ncbi:MAG: nucleotidyltransferase domain-containing protein [Nanoarchaeota archaeon]|nr:nucleotidyltransferase domain-containing protein [Nanoarchaeota archaeon]